MELGPSAAAAIPVLEKMMTDRTYESHRLIAAHVLAAIGPEAVPALVKGAASRDSETRHCAISALETLGSLAKPASEVLRRGLADEYYITRCQSAITLGNIGEAPQVWIPTLLELLQHTNNHIRSRVAQTLGRFGTNSVEAIPALRQAAQDPDDTVRNSAANALKQIDPEAASKASVE